MPRAWAWLQVIIGWIPVWALYASLLYFMHPPASAIGVALAAVRAVAPAALLGIGIHRFAHRFPWPRPFRFRFVAAHLVAAGIFSATWILAVSAVESFVRGHLGLIVGPGITAFLVLGVWLYVMVAGVSYAEVATGRAARAEALAARSQLAALRAQLHPHFLFNALHTVVQLIPREPARAGEAAEQVARLLRTTIEEDRDLVPLGDEWDFVSRYLEIERIRFGDRLDVRVQISGRAREALVPSFGLQTLVENAVRHGAAPKVEPTEIHISADVRDEALEVRVRDTGAGVQPGMGAGEPDGGRQRARQPAPRGALAADGSGLSRLRERLRVLYGDAARLTLDAAPGSGFTATLTVPLSRPGHAADGEDEPA
ncbi:MAG: sensor histidine kinase [Gemmatimonadales bacterium]